MSKSSAELLEEIGRHVGVSKRTVSRVLSGELRDKRPTIVERARQIHTMAERLGYRPNAAAKAISTGRFGSVALLMSRSLDVSVLPWRLLQSINNALADRDQHLIHACLPDEELTATGFVPRVLREMSCDGFLINYTHRIPPAMIRQIEASSVPATWLNTKRDADCVYPDDFEAGRRVVKELLFAGHRRIAFADRSHPTDQVQPHHSSHDREAGYRRAMAEAGLEPLVLRPDRPLEPDERPQFFVESLRRPDRPTAMIGYGYTTTVPIALAAAHLQLTLPDDLSLARFGDVGDTTDGIESVRVATMVLPYEAMGREAVRQLTSKIERENKPRAPVAIPFEFDPGESIVSPPA